MFLLGDTSCGIVCFFSRTMELDGLWCLKHHRPSIWRYLEIFRRLLRKRKNYMQKSLQAKLAQDRGGWGALFYSDRTFQPGIQLLYMLEFVVEKVLKINAVILLKMETVWLLQYITYSMEDCILFIYLFLYIISASYIIIRFLLDL